VLACESPDLAKNLLWMRTGQDNRAFAYFTVHHCSSAFTRLDVQTLGIACKHLHTSILVLFSINKDTAAIVVRAETCGTAPPTVVKASLLTLNSAALAPASLW
jgi:hypothetical protein